MQIVVAFGDLFSNNKVFFYWECVKHTSFHHGSRSSIL
jgi:hypothetical protein